MKIVRNNLLSVIYAVALVAVACLTSCKSEPVPEPPVMDEATFVDYLADAYLLEGYYSLQTHYRFDSLQPQMIASYDTLMARYGITRDVFDTTIRWYTHHPDIFMRVQDSVMARLTPSPESGEAGAQ